MSATLPDSATLQVPSTLASQLLEAAESLPIYDNKDFYDVGLQTHVYGHIRHHCLEGFDWLVERIKLRLEQRPYCALVANLQFDEGNRLFVGLNRAFGELVARPYEKPRAQLVHYIQQVTDRPAAQHGQYESEKLHTDTADWESLVELISMVCIRADESGGGRSVLLDVDTLRHEVRDRLGSDVLALLASQPVPWRLGPDQGDGVHWRPVLTDSCICWRRYTIDAALESLDSQMSDELVAVLEEFEKVVVSTPRTIEFLMRENEILFLDNRRTLHARTPLHNGADRLMIRSWIRTEEPRQQHAVS